MDMSAPLKKALSLIDPEALEAYLTLQRRVEVALCMSLGIQLEWLHRPEVRAADVGILLDERDAVMAPPPQDWLIPEHLALGVDIRPWTPGAAKRAFVALFEVLQERLLRTAMPVGPQPDTRFLIKL